MPAEPRQDLDALAGRLLALPAASDLVAEGGRVVALRPDAAIVRGLPAHARIGDVVRFGALREQALGEVLHIEGGECIVARMTGLSGLVVGEAAFHLGAIRPQADESWLGRVVDALGRPVDGRGPLASTRARARAGQRHGALDRGRVSEAFRTGVRVIDLFTPLCIGQRFGVFAGSGVGKSTLLAMLARAGAFDAVVVALVGERSREVREFVEDTLGADTMAKSLVVAATGDESAIMRRRAAPLAMGFAEALRDRGRRVLFLLDSVTRFAHALRETGIAAGQPPVQRGYPATVFAEMPMLLERAGPGGAQGGSITAIVTVLVDGDDHNDPVADTMRGILDGHLVLERAIADAGRYPPVNALSSISRLASRVWTPQQAELITSLRALIARFEETRDLRLLGGWQRGVDPELDKAVETVPQIYRALHQTPQHPRSADPFAELAELLRHENRAG
ncbi:MULTISPECIES: FliI/YscN family ATPase [unclassified Roseitalea]|uniref:FliI/YscN family ATPase n=1 Tax=unclassified Roseitalea TaxID=2639107 RepID=UPI00273F6EEF|nr:MULTISPECIES: FliI/YscN family ATPase [unclassified Roseitalea]